MTGSTSQMLDLAQMSALTPFFFVVDTLLPGASLTVLAPNAGRQALPEAAATQEVG
jgi:hypothetical protein